MRVNRAVRGALSNGCALGGGGGPLIVNGVTVGDAGTGFYSGYKLAAGDDFNGNPTRWTGANLTGKYGHSTPAYGFRGTSTTIDNHMFIDPAYRGTRSESPTDLGYDGISVANSIATFTAQAPAAPLLAYLPTTYTGGRGDGSNHPLIVSGTLKTWPHFMLSAKADFIIECRVRFPAGVARGFWPAFWCTTLFWPDSGEVDVVEVKKDVTGVPSPEGHLHISTSDGAGDTPTTIYAPIAETNGTFIQFAVVKSGTTLTIYDDHVTPGTYASLGTYTNARVGRIKGAHDIRLDFSVAAGWDSSTFTAGDWPKALDFDWWRAWVPTAAAALNAGTNVLAAINVAPGGSWATTLPSTTTLYGAGPPAGLEQVSAAWDNFDAPGMATRDATTKLPTSMTVDLGTRAVTGTVPTTEGGCMPLFLTYAYDDGTPARRVMQPYNIAPAEQATLFANFSLAVGGAISQTIAYTDFHSGNLGPHTYHVTHDGGAGVTVTNNDTGTVTLGGVMPSSTVTYTIVATNSIGQTTSVQRTASVVTATQFFTDTFTGTNGTALTSHTPDSGGTWSKIAGTGTPTIQTNRICTITSASTSRAETTAPANNYYVEGVFDLITDLAGDSVGVMGRVSSSAESGYLFRYSQTADTWSLFRLDAGVATALGSTFADNWTTGSRTVRLEMNGSTINGYVDGTLRCTATDATYAGPGKPGIRLATTQTTGTGRHITSLIAFG